MIPQLPFGNKKWGFFPPADTEQFPPVIKSDRLQPSLAMFTQKQTDAFIAIGFKQPADFIPCAKLKRTLNDQVRVTGQVKPRNVIFLKIRFQPFWDFWGWNLALHFVIITR